MADQTLNSNTATMTTSNGVTLKTAGHYIPHDIKVSPSSTFEIKSNIDNLTLNKALTTITQYNKVTTLNQVGPITNLNQTGEETSTYTQGGVSAITTANIKGTLNITTLQGSSGILKLTDFQTGVTPTIENTYGTINFANVKNGGVINITNLESGSNFNITGNFYNSSTIASIGSSTTKGILTITNVNKYGQLDIGTFAGDGTINNISNCLNIESVNGTLTLFGKDTTITSSKIGITSLANRNLTIDTLSNSVTISNFATNSNSSISTAVNIGSVKVANENGLITATPTFSRGTSSVTVGITPGNAVLSDTNSSGISIKADASGSIANTTYKEAVKGWVDIAKGTTAYSNSEDEPSDSETKYLSEITIGSGKTLSKVANSGTITSLINSSTIGTLSGTGSISTYSGAQTITTFTGSITYGSATMKYDSTNKAVVFTY